MYADVIVDIVHSNIDRVFQYSVGENSQLKVGSRVLVPFGAGNRQTEGFVVGFREEAEIDTARIKQIIKPLEDYGALLKEQVVLAKWMKEHYGCLMVEALRLMIPAQMRNGRINEKLLQIVSLKDGISAEELASEIDQLKRAPVQAGILSLLQEKNEISLKELQEVFKGALPAVHSLEKRELVTLSGVRQMRTPYKNMSTAFKGKVTLTEPQQTAVDRIISAVENKGGSFLLKGVTGSGKTEVYMQVISYCIEKGISSILLVPEIALTPQMVGNLRKRFGEKIAVIHSALSSGERFDEWYRIRTGQAQVAIGARSAVFSPFEKIGLIVIDEEHETSYKADNSPRYDAHEIAKQRCKTHGAALVLGSATPSVETYYNCIEKKEYELIELNDRINNRPLPKVQVVDMCQELADGNRTIFSKALYSALKETITIGQQAILFLNRRGFSTFVACRGCGYVVMCENCDVSLTYHHAQHMLKCHYCGHEETPKTICPVCGKPYLKYFGVGTQQVEQEVKKLFEGVNVLRMDMDTTRTKDAHLNIFNKFAKGEAQVLIGTQMVAKGLDFANVTLVGVVAADASLYMPDFRSVEKTFQLIEQVAGRAGRDKSPGKVVVQTYSKEHPAIKFAAAHDYNGFYKYEINERKKSAFPPFATYLRAVFSSADGNICREAALAFQKQATDVLKGIYKETINDNVHTLKCNEAPINRIKSNFRWHVVIKINVDGNTNNIIKLLSDILREDKFDSCLTGLEINPSNML